VTATGETGLLLFWILVALLGLAALLALAIPILLWWAFQHGAEVVDKGVSAPSRITDYFSPAVWRAYISWMRDRPLQLTDRSEK
jgi:hypothetical protein